MSAGQRRRSRRSDEVRDETRRKAERMPARQEHAPRTERPTVTLVDEDPQREASKIGRVTICVVHDLSKVLDAKSTRLHGDVIDALVDLVVELLDEETGHGEGQDR